MLYTQILTKYSDLFTEKEKTQIAGLLARACVLLDSEINIVGNNKYLVGIIVVPFMLNETDAYRKATQNMLVFCEEAVNQNSAFARQVVNETIESPIARLQWFYEGLHCGHPVFPLLMEGENGTRRRKGLPVVEYSLSTYEDCYSIMQMEAINEIKNSESPAPGFWWPDDPDNA